MVKQAGSSQPKRTMARSSRATSASKSPPKVNGHSSETSKKRPREGAQETKAKRQRILKERINKLEENNKFAKAGLVLSLGTGDTGQLGLGEDILERSKPALVKGIEGQIVAIAAGGMHTICLTKDGEVWSFGCNDEGALGRSIEDDEEGFTPGKISLPAGTSIVQITAGDSHSAALDSKGKVYYWGTFRDGSGAIGLTHDGNIQKLPVPLGHHLIVKKIASGVDHIALLTESGELHTLGNAEQGQLGRVGARYASRGGQNRKGLDMLLKPEKVVPKNQRTVFTNVWAGSYDTIALTTENEILACGLNNYNQLGIKKGNLFHTLVKSSGFTEALAGKSWKNIAFGQHHALGLDEMGRVHAIGRVEYGRLGLGDKETEGGKNDAIIPTLIPKLADKKCVDVSCGTAVSFAVTEDGECYSWGMVTNGQLGQSQDDDDAWEPQRMVGKQLENRKVVAVAGGGQHTLLIAKEDSPKKNLSNGKQDVDQVVPDLEQTS